MVLLLAVTPLAARWYDRSEIVGLMVLIAATVPLGAATIVPQAMLRSEMRFRALAIVTSLQTFIRVVFCVVLALLDFGAYSFVVPRLIATAVTLTLLLWIAKPNLRMSVSFPQIRLLLTDTMVLSAAKFCLSLTQQSDVLILGCFEWQAVVGAYFFACMLSRQTFVLLTQNIGGVLFPGLSTLQDEPVRQMRTYLRAVRMLAIIGMPLAFLLAAVAEPLLVLLFADKWVTSVPLLQILGVGMAFRLVGSTGGSLLQAQGRFMAKLKSNIAYALIFVTLVAFGASQFGAVGVAWAATMYFLIVGLGHIYI